MARQNVTHNVGSATGDYPEPGRRLLDLVRGKFVIAGSSLNRWCAENGVSRHAALAALTGASIGDEAQRLRIRLLKAAGVDQPVAA